MRTAAPALQLWVSTTRRERTRRERMSASALRSALNKRPTRHVEARWRPTPGPPAAHSAPQLAPPPIGPHSAWLLSHIAPETAGIQFCLPTVDITSSCPPHLTTPHPGTRWGARGGGAPSGGSGGMQADSQGLWHHSRPDQSPLVASVRYVESHRRLQQLGGARQSQKQTREAAGLQVG